MTQVQGMTIACPEGWLDKSMLVLTAAQPGPSGVSPSFVVTRETVPDDATSDPTTWLNGFVDRQVEQMRATLPGLVDIARRQSPGAGGSPELKVDWVSDGIPITQWISYADAGPNIVMIATGTAGRADFDAQDPVFRAMLRSFRVA